VSVDTKIECKFKKASSILVVMIVALNRLYASVKNQVSTAMSARTRKGPIGALSMAAKAVLRSALLSVAGGFGAFASIITDVRGTERTVLISIVNGGNDLGEVKILKK